MSRKSPDRSELYTTEYTRFEHKDVPESAFDLSAFGLHELQVPGVPPPGRKWLWFLLGGVVFGGAAVGIRCYVDRKRKPTISK